MTKMPSPAEEAAMLVPVLFDMAARPIHLIPRLSRKGRRELSARSAELLGTAASILYALLAIEEHTKCPEHPCICEPTDSTNGASS